jgi:hypothetical protein
MDRLIHKSLYFSSNVVATKHAASKVHSLVRHYIWHVSTGRLKTSSGRSSPRIHPWSFVVPVLALVVTVVAVPATILDLSLQNNFGTDSAGTQPTESF